MTGPAFLGGTDTERPVSRETLERVKKEAAQADAAPPGAEGTRRALEDNALGWAEDFDQEAERLVVLLERAREAAAFWHRVAAAIPCGPGAAPLDSSAP